MVIKVNRYCCTFLILELGRCRAVSGAQGGEAETHGAVLRGHKKAKAETHVDAHKVACAAKAETHKVTILFEFSTYRYAIHSFVDSFLTLLSFISIYIIYRTYTDHQNDNSIDQSQCFVASASSAAASSDHKLPVSEKE